MPATSDGNIKTETEIKFIIPDYHTFAALKVRRKLGDFRIKPLSTKKFVDRYLDTTTRAIIQAGFACRIRTVEGEHTLTLKSLSPPDSQIHRRQEIEAEVKSDKPQAWPASLAKKTISEIVGSASLQTLFTLYQTRHKFHVIRQGKPVMELSLDEVSHTEANKADYFELEAELIKSGSEADLNHFISALQAQWGLQSENQSKFERAFAAEFGQDTGQGAAQLSDLEKLALGKIANLKNKQLAKRAMIILMSDVNAEPDNIAREVELTVRTVKRWQKLFTEKRMEIFPTNVIVTPAAPQPKVIKKRQPLGQTHPLFHKKSTKPKKKKKKTAVKYRQKKIGIQPTDSLADAGRKILGFHFARMLKHEAGTRLGADIEELHDMRVATRRMRAAFRVFRQGFLKKTIAPLLVGLKETGRALGPMRDLDVFMEKLRDYQQSLPEAEQAGLAPMLEIWQTKRDKARKEMLTYLDSKKYLKFKRNFLKFVKTKGMGAKAISYTLPPVPYQLRHVGPRLIYYYYEEVRAYETILDKAPIETLHQLRITFKGLRYTLEYLNEILGDEAKQVIAEVKTIQDHLGDMNDADVAVVLLRGFLEDWEAQQLHLPWTERQNPTQIVNYLNANLDKRHRLLVTFPEAWARFNHHDVRQNLAKAISVL